MPRPFEHTVEIGTVAAVAGVILLGSGIALDSVTANDAPWIGSWLDDVFSGERVIGAALIGLGVLVYLALALTDAEADYEVRAGDVDTAVLRDESARARIQRMFNPPVRAKPDWGETLRGLGFLAAILAVLWYWGGAPPVGEYHLSWLRQGLGAYGESVIVLAITVVAFAALRSSIAHPGTRRVLELPEKGAAWTVRQVALGLGIYAFGLITGAGLGVFD